MTPQEKLIEFQRLQRVLSNCECKYEERESLKEKVKELFQSLEPFVGMGCTICYWSDKRAVTVTDVEYAKSGKPKAVVVTHNKTKCLDWYANEYEILPELEDGRTDRFTLRKNGRWYMEGQETSPNSVVLMLHYQAHSIDPSF